MTQNDSNSHYRTNDLRLNPLKLFKKERVIVSAALCLLIVFSVADFFEDRAEGASGQALFSDISDALLPVILLIYIWRFKPWFSYKKTTQLESELAQKNADVSHWKEKAAGYLRGLSESIDEQFNIWQLTRAEKEVALLLLKGFSLKELSQMRDTSERTSRQQAARIYSKAGIKGRAELSAFFLEDLMVPITN